MEKVIERNRESNIEFLRIIAMFMVTMIHCIDNGLILNNIENLSLLNFISVSYVRVFVGIANGLFLIITGYFQISNKLNLKKIINLWGKTIFYTIGILIFIKIIGRSPNYFSSIFPLSTGIYWFINAYIALYIFAPIINIMLNKINKNQFKFLIILMIFIFGILRIVILADTFNGIFFTTIFYYILGGYIRKYITIDPKKKYFTKFILFTILTTCIYIILFVLMKIVPNDIAHTVIKKIYSNFLDFGNIFFIIMTVLLFLKFKTINIKSKKINKLINFLAPSMLAIYIIQQDIHFRALWRLDGALEFGNTFFMIPYMLLIVSGVFLICLVIDIIRRALYVTIKKISFISDFIIHINKQIDILNNKLNAYIS